MDLASLLNKLKDKWKSYTKNKKVALIVFFVGAIIGVSYLLVYLTTPKYDVLFYNMEPKDASAVIAKLKEKKISTKVSNNNVYVPEDQVEELRMEMLSSVTFTGSSTGFELFDTSKFGITDMEMKINYQRALEGEIERTIKSFSEIESARVHLVLPDDSGFVKDTSSSKASVTLNLKTGSELSNEQVKAIVALLSGSVKNLKKEKVEVIDNHMNLLTEESGDTSGAISSQKQQSVKRTFEVSLEESISSMLQAIYGKDKVRVNIFADLNFDSNQKDIIKFDPVGVIKSQQKIIDGQAAGTGDTSSSPVDNNMNNTSGDTTTGTTGRTETITNFEVGKTEEKIIKAPGAINKISTSVAIDGNINEDTKNIIKNLVQGAIGYDLVRGDTLYIEGIAFNTEAKDAAQKDIDELNALKISEAKTQLYKKYAIAGGSGVLFLVFLISLIKMLKSSKSKNEEKDEFIFKDTVVAETIIPKSINLEFTSEKEHLENEIKSYASKKPEQVIDIVKSWLSEDER